MWASSERCYSSVWGGEGIREELLGGGWKVKRRWPKRKCKNSCWKEVTWGVRLSESWGSVYGGGRLAERGCKSISCGWVNTFYRCTHLESWGQRRTRRCLRRVLAETADLRLCCRTWAGRGPTSWHSLPPASASQTEVLLHTQSLILLWQAKCIPLCLII